MLIVPWIVAALLLSGKGATWHGAAPAVPGLPGGTLRQVKTFTAYVYVLVFGLQALTTKPVQQPVAPKHAPTQYKGCAERVPGAPSTIFFISLRTGLCARSAVAC